MSSSRYAPLTTAREENREAGVRTSRAGGAAVAALLILSGITVAFARGQGSIIESFGVSQEAALAVAWVLQGGLAVICFLLVIRWLTD
jgi:hypothetical protein